MDIVYYQPLKELLAVSSYFKEKNILILVSNEIQEKKAKQVGLIPCYLISEKTPDSELQKLKDKRKAVIGGSVKSNEFAVRIKSNFLLQPSNTGQYFDLGLAKKLSDNNIVVVFMFEELLSKNSFERHKYWKNYLDVVNYCKRKNTKFFVASGCKEPLNMRSKKVRIAIAETLGFSLEKASSFIEGLI
jgi:RNase P/RNase MRP subunit p30